jgi:predicted Zn-dependent protease
VSFGAIRTTRLRTSIANSFGLRAQYRHTLVEVELAVKAFGGPEGAPPGEYWVNDATRRLATDRLGSDVEAWCRYASDVRRAVAPPTGELAVVLPPGVLSGILPQVLGFRLSGAGRLRKVSPEVGSTLAAEGLTLSDDGRYPWGIGSGPFDAEGTPSQRSPLIEGGTLRGLLYDALHAGAFGASSTGSAVRAGFGPHPWLKFRNAPVPGSSTLVVAEGSAGSDAELCEAAGDGLWVQQLGWASPDAVSGAYGGEVRIGYRIRAGKLAEPVRGGIVGGLAIAPSGKPSLLANVAAIGGRVELCEGLATPPLLIRPLTVAGT